MHTDMATKIFTDRAHFEKVRLAHTENTPPFAGFPSPLQLAYADKNDIVALLLERCVCRLQTMPGTYRVRLVLYDHNCTVRYTGGMMTSATHGVACNWRDL